MPSKSQSRQKSTRQEPNTSRVMQFPTRNAGPQKEPKSPLPPQRQERPGIEARMEPRPRYEAPLYKGSEKLKDKVAIITAGDSGIGRAVAVLYARESADAPVREPGPTPPTKR